MNIDRVCKVWSYIDDYSESWFPIPDEFLVTQRKS